MAGEEAPVSRLRHVVELDGIRGIAAMMVFFHHAFYADLVDKAWTGAGGWLVRLSSVGDSGVDLFFVLSGFLITSLLIQDRGNQRYYQDFYWKRTLRILPLYFVSLLVMLVLQHNLGSVVVAAFFLANFSNVFHVEAAGPFWTLAIEEQFYLLWPSIIRRRRLEQIARWAFLLGITAIALRLLFAWRGHYNYHLSFLRCDGLAFGAVLAVRHRARERSAERIRQERKVLLGLLLLGAVLIEGSAWIVNGQIGAHIAWWAAFRQTGITLVAGSAVGLVLDAQGSRALAFLRSRVLLWLGLVSYALYIIHGEALYVYDAHFGRPTPGHTGALLLRGAVVLPVTLLLCVASRYWLELPAISLRKRVLSKPNPTAEMEEPPLPLAQM